MPNIKNIQYSTDTTGATITAADTSDDLLIIHENAILTTALTIAFPANPVDGQQIRISTVNGITALSLTAAVGSIVNALTTMVAGGVGGYVYRKANTKWYKVF